MTARCSSPPASPRSRRLRKRADAAGSVAAVAVFDERRSPGRSVARTSTRVRRITADRPIAMVGRARACRRGIRSAAASSSAPAVRGTTRTLLQHDRLDTYPETEPRLAPSRRTDDLARRLQRRRAVWAAGICKIGSISDSVTARIPILGRPDGSRSSAVHGADSSDCVGRAPDAGHRARLRRRPGRATRARVAARRAIVVFKADGREVQDATLLCDEVQARPARFGVWLGCRGETVRRGRSRATSGRARSRRDDVDEARRAVHPPPRRASADARASTTSHPGTQWRVPAGDVLRHERRPRAVRLREAGARFRSEHHRCGRRHHPRRQGAEAGSVAPG